MDSKKSFYCQVTLNSLIMKLLTSTKKFWVCIVCVHKEIAIVKGCAKTLRALYLYPLWVRGRNFFLFM